MFQIELFSVTLHLIQVCCVLPARPAPCLQQTSETAEYSFKDDNTKTIVTRQGPRGALGRVEGGTDAAFRSRVVFARPRQESSSDSDPVALCCVPDKSGMTMTSLQSPQGFIIIVRLLLQLTTDKHKGQSNNWRSSRRNEVDKIWMSSSFVRIFIRFFRPWNCCFRHWNNPRNLQHCAWSTVEIR